MATTSKYSGDFEGDVLAQLGALNERTESLIKQNGEIFEQLRSGVRDIEQLRMGGALLSKRVDDIEKEKNAASVDRKDQNAVRRDRGFTFFMSVITVILTLTAAIVAQRVFHVTL